MELPVVNHPDYVAKINDDNKFPIKKFGALADHLIKEDVVKKFYIDQKDEQLLISSKTNLITKKHRIDCINAAISKNFKYAIFDDGLQDKSINYDLKICCFNSDNWIGNGYVLPAGPLREKISSLKN